MHLLYHVFARAAATNAYGDGYGPWACVSSHQTLEAARAAAWAEAATTANNFGAPQVRVYAHCAAEDAAAHCAAQPSLRASEYEYDDGWFFGILEGHQGQAYRWEA